MKVHVPPIKCQGIKTKLVPLIVQSIDRDPDGLWIEPFLGSGVVALNVAPSRALLADSNPHIVRFYQSVKKGLIDGAVVRGFLEQEAAQLSVHGKDYYYEVRERFNSYGNPLDFLFLNRSCFNGIIRFNNRGKFNVPFCNKPDRFAPAYITKIVNQVNRFQSVVKSSDWDFVCQDFRDTLRHVSDNDFVYCDPPYIGRHVDYYHNWDEQSEMALYRELKSLNTHFMLSTWHSNQHRHNEFLQDVWSEFTILTREHFYHVGAYETNRKPMIEALVMNYTPLPLTESEWKSAKQLVLLEKVANYVEAEIDPIHVEAKS